MREINLFYTITRWSFLTGLFICVLGVVLAAIDRGGETEFTFFGQSLRSRSVGLSVIFIGATLIVLNIWRALKSSDKSEGNKRRIQSGVMAPGQLIVTDVQVVQNTEAKTCSLDFRISNSGGSEIVVNEIRLEVIDVVSIPTRGFMEFSKFYDLDISSLKRKGDFASCKVSQIIKPGESDRFGIILIGKELGAGVFRGWLLHPTIQTNYGAFSANPIEVWLPYRRGNENVADLKISKRSH